ncbi:MAG: hypothetical protein AVDCRST_MAG56-6683 [uncultured Cytophagales bacterium]|uniref:Uncharacterized protein n=1 Tax=uncultured Cytophagales bacterium TaxID=158755 RepID=A0A6J4KW56_9SPHI|nr:MAG: hypothetical protein AVDCRST_MAG56-6683 [uncultured Cytophagales bacterium]
MTPQSRKDCRSGGNRRPRRQAVKAAGGLENPSEYWNRNI